MHTFNKHIFLVVVSVVREDMEVAYDLAFGPDGEPMTVAQLMVTLLHGTHKEFYDALLQNVHVHEGVDDLDVDTLLMAVRHAPRLEEIGAAEGWGCFWMDLCALTSSSSTRLRMGREIAGRGFGHVLVDSLMPRPNVVYEGKDLSRIQDRVAHWTSNFANVWCWRDPELVMRADFLPHLLDFSDEDMVQFLKLGSRDALTMAQAVWEADGAVDEEAALECQGRGWTVSAQEFRARRARVLAMLARALALIYA
jgi:hypothetical protein